MKKFLVILLAVLFLSGCAVRDDMKTVQEGLDLQVQKEQAHQVMASALDEFYTGIPSAADPGLASAGYSVKDTIIGYAFEAYNSGDDTKLMNYLKEQGLYEKYRNIAKKYELEAHQEVLNTKADNIGLQSVTASFINNSLDGDIFLCYGGSSSSKLIGFFIPGIWKHAGFMDTLAPDPSAPVLSASSETTSGFCVGYEPTSKWVAKPAVSAWRVYNRTSAKARAALNYSKQFIGRPYSVFVGRMDNSSWYCSKVVWRGWLSQGIDLEPTPSVEDPWVTPTDLGEDSNSYWIGGDQS